MTTALLAGPFEPKGGQGIPRTSEVVVGQDQFRFTLQEFPEGPKRYTRVLSGGRGRSFVEAADGAFVEALNRDVYDSLEAAALVEDARQVDPMCCPAGQASRDRAVELYQKAIAAAPAAKINAPLANRIAQLYAFYADEEKKVRPIRSKASQWWNRCADCTSPKQLLWAQAQMGLASTAVINGDHASALAIYSRILDLDAAAVELPAWKAWPDGSSENGKLRLEQEQARLLESVKELQAAAVETQFYVLCRIDRATAMDALQNVAARFKGTAPGDRASSIAAKIHNGGVTEPWPLPDLTTTNVAGTQLPSPPKPEVPQKNTTAPPPALPVAIGASRRNGWRLGVASFATIGVAATVGFMWTRRRKRLSWERKTR